MTTIIYKTDPPADDAALVAAQAVVNAALASINASVTSAAASAAAAAASAGGSLSGAFPAIGGVNLTISGDLSASTIEASGTIAATGALSGASLTTTGSATVGGNLTVTGTISGPRGSFLPLAGGTVTGPLSLSSTLTLAADPTTALQPATKHYVDLEAASRAAAVTVGSLGLPTFDFSNGVDANWTFSRSSITFEYSTSGQAAFIASGTPAIRFDPKTGSYAGLSLYDAATNLQPNVQAVVSEALGAWTLARGTIDTADTPAALPGLPAQNAPTFIPTFGAAGVVFVPFAPSFGRYATYTEDNISNTGLHGTLVPLAAANATTYLFGVFLKSGTRTQAQLQMDTFTSLSGGGTAASAAFNLSTGAIITTSGANVTATIADAGNGWWWCTIQTTTVVGGGAARALILSYASGTSVTGNGSTFLMMGAVPYCTPTGGYLGVGGPVAGPAGTPNPQAPLALNQAFEPAVQGGTLFTEGTTVAVLHGISSAATFANATPYTWAAFLKAGTRTQAQLQIDGVTSLVGGGTVASAAFDLVAGTVVTSSGANVTATIEYAGTGYYRCAITTTTVTGGTGRALILGYSSGTSYTGTNATFSFAGVSLSATAYMPPYIGPTALPHWFIDGSVALVTQELGVATTTRAADAIVMAGGTFSANIGGSVFLIGCNAIIPQAAPSGADQTIWQLDDTTDNNRIALVVQAGSLNLALRVVLAGVTTYVPAGRAAVPGAVTGIVVQRNASKVLSIWVNGATPASKVFASLPSQTAMRLGNNVAGTAPLNGRILSLSPLAKVAPDASAQLVSTAAVIPTPAYSTDPDWTFIVLPDTQHAVTNVPAAWTALYSWIISQKTTLNIKMVLGVGDVTDDAGATAMAAGAAGYDAMNAAGIPAMPNIGNHDYTAAMTVNGTTQTTGHQDPQWQATFTRAWFAKYAWFGGCFGDVGGTGGTTENWWGTVTVGSRTYLMLNLETFPRPAVITWAQGILDANPVTPCIFMTHSFLYCDGTLVTNSTPNCASAYFLTDGGLDGSAVWTNLVSLNRQICMVFCGHHIGPAYTAYAPMTGLCGNTVHVMFTNHQEELSNNQPLLSVGGGCRATVLQFKPSQGLVEVSSYDPAVSAYQPADVREWRFI